MEAGDNIRMISNLLPVTKSKEEYVLKNKIDKVMQLNSQQFMNHSCTMLNIMSLNKLMPVSPPLPLPEIGEIKAKMQNKLFSSVDLSQMFFSVRLTKRSQAYL